MVGGNGVCVREWWAEPKCAFVLLVILSFFRHRSLLYRLVGGRGKGYGKGGRFLVLIWEKIVI